jgi:hypothetical protein
MSMAQQATLSQTEAIPRKSEEVRCQGKPLAACPAGKGYVIRIGEEETSQEKDLDKFTWIRIVVLSDTHNKCVLSTAADVKSAARLPLVCEDMH